MESEEIAMKKILNIFLTLFVMLHTSSVFALNCHDNAEKAEVLESLGIMDKENESEYVTRDEFFNGILHLFYEDDEIYSVIEQSESLGLLDSKKEEDFNGDTYITYNDAIAVAVTALGYERANLLNGEYPSAHISVARSIGLLEGVGEKRTLSLKRSSVINLFYNMLSAEPYMLSIGTDSDGYSIVKCDSLLSMQRDIYEISGIVTANEYTSLTKPEGNLEKQITINNENYYIDDIEFGNYLGMYVEGYIQKSVKNEDDKVIFIHPKGNKNNEIEIEANEILTVSEDCSRIEYIKNGTERNKYAKISNKARVIYNNKFFDKYTYEDFIPKQGSVRLVDNNNDDIYDCVFITSYETMIVDYVDYQKAEIFGKYADSDALNYLKLDKEEDNPDINYYFGKEEVSIKKIAKNDILTIRRSKNNGDILADVYISRNTVTGMAYGLNEEENTIKINDEECKVAKVFYDEMNVSGKILTSENYKFYFDVFGELVYAEKSASSDYCMFYKIFEDDSGDMEFEITYMNDNSEWYTVPLSKNVRYNGTTVSAKNVYEDMKLLDPQIVVIKCNSEGKVKTITTAEIGKKGEKILAKTAEQQMRYRSNPNAFNCSLYMEDDAKVFVVPGQKAMDRDEYYVTNSSFFQGDETYRITAYDVDEFNFSHLFVVVSDEEIAKSTLSYRFFIVTEMSEKLNDEGDVVETIKGVMGSYVNLEYEAKDEHTFDGLSKGSIIRIHTDNNNKVDYWQPLTGSTNTDLWVNVKVIEATVVGNDPEGGKFKIDWNGNEVYLKNNASVIVNIFDGKENSCTAGSIGDLIPGDKVFVRTNWAVPVEILIVR